MKTFDQIWTNWATDKHFDLTTGEEVTMPVPAISPSLLETKTLEELVAEDIMTMFNIGSCELEEKKEYYATRYWQELLV